jgi:hypothetical protein
MRIFRESRCSCTHRVGILILKKVGNLESNSYRIFLDFSGAVPNESYHRSEEWMSTAY